MESLKIGKIIIYVGIAIIIFGILFIILNKMGIHIGKLPGDIKIHKEKYFIYFPIISSIVISVLLTLIINFVFWFLKK